MNPLTLCSHSGYSLLPQLDMQRLMFKLNNGIETEDLISRLRLGKVAPPAGITYQSSAATNGNSRFRAQPGQAVRFGNISMLETGDLLWLPGLCDLAFYERIDKKLTYRLRWFFDKLPTDVGGECSDLLGRQSCFVMPGPCNYCPGQGKELPDLLRIRL